MTSEREFQAQVCQVAEILGWRWVHVRPSIAKGGKWATTTNIPVPDLYLFHPARGGHMWRELKVPKGAGGRVLDSQWKPGQFEILTELMAAGVDAALWVPAHLDNGRIQRELTANRTRGAA